MIKAIIIDDDIITCKLISGFISKTEGVELEKVFNKPLEAVTYLEENPVDLVFVDIEMPDINGIEFVQLFKDQPVSFVIVSAHDKYAVKGFELNVLDYLQKPVSQFRFLAAIDKVKKKVSPSKPSSRNENSEYVFLKSEGKVQKYRMDEIDYIKALGDYVAIHLGENVITQHMTMNQVEKSIKSNILVRLHRSAIVNVNKIDNIEDHVVSIGQELFPIGKKYKDHFYSHINLL